MNKKFWLGVVFLVVGFIVTPADEWFFAGGGGTHFMPRSLLPAILLTGIGIGALIRWDEQRKKLQKKNE